MGPSLNLQARDPNYLRLSSQNLLGQQGTVTAIAIHPTLAGTWLVVDRPDNGGSGLWRTTNAGDSWTPVLDAVLASSLPGYGFGTDPTCVAFHPNLAGVAYFGCGSAGTFFLSPDGGATWTLQHSFSSFVRRIFVNPTTGTTTADEANTEIWVVLNDDDATNTANGIWYSVDNGVSWAQGVAGLFDSFAPDFQTSGTTAFAGRRSAGGAPPGGLAYSGTPKVAASWTNLATGTTVIAVGGSGTLPGPTATSPGYDRMLVARVPSAPGRVYVVTSDESHTNLYRSVTGSAGPWTRIALPTGLGGVLAAYPQNGFRNFVFAISPASPATPSSGSADVLFTGGVLLGRSTDGGASWHVPTDYHADIHAIVFDQGTTPVLYVGCDGGLARSTLYGGTTPTPSSENFNEGATVDPASGVLSNLNRGKYGSCVFQLAAHPALRALSYIGCQDTGVTAGGGSLTWRAVDQADAGSLAVAPGPTGVVVWNVGGLYGPYPFFWVAADVDNGVNLLGAYATLGGLNVGSLSNYVVNSANECVAGLASRDDSTAALRYTVGSSPPGFALQWVTLTSVANIQVGGFVTFHPGFDSSTDIRSSGPHDGGRHQRLRRQDRHRRHHDGDQPGSDGRWSRRAGRGAQSGIEHRDLRDLAARATLRNVESRVGQQLSLPRSILGHSSDLGHHERDERAQHLGSSDGRRADHAVRDLLGCRVE
jgi:hypothetical protein